jgi:hypothetical protein
MAAESNKVPARAVFSRSSDKDKNELQHSTRPAEEEPPLRTYEIYVERGKTDGHDLADWLQAENELPKTAERNPPIDIVHYTFDC